MKLPLLRFRLLGGIALVLAAVAALSPSAAAQPIKRTCGYLPGPGAFNITKTQGVTCSAADNVIDRVIRRFCARGNNCNYGPRTPTTRVYRGQLQYRGWQCQITQGYELSIVNCRRDQQQISHESGA